MQTTFKRDLNTNYMIIQVPNEIIANYYQVKMLTSNVIAGLLDCHVKTENETLSFYYEITSKQTLERVFQKQQLRYQDLLSLLTSLSKTIETVKEYLLDCNNIILDPEHIYINTQKKEIFFCYLPEWNQDICESFHQLAEFLLNRLDHKDQKGVALGYSIYQQSLEENFSIYKILQSVEQEERPKQPEKPIVQEELIDSRESKGHDRLMEQEKPIERNKSISPEAKPKVPLITMITDLLENDKIKQWVVPIGVGFGIIVFLGYLSRGFWLSFDPLTLAGIIVLILSLGGYLLYQMFCYRFENKQEMEEAPIFRLDETNDLSQILFQPAPDHKVEEIEKTVLLCPEPQIKIASLVWDDRSDKEDLKLPEEECMIGKMKDAVDVVIDSPQISRIHARIFKKNEEYYVMDLNSTNGTFINDEEIEINSEVRLNNGDQIRFANIPFHFHY